MAFAANNEEAYCYCWLATCVVVVLPAVYSRCLLPNGSVVCCDPTWKGVVTSYFVSCGALLFAHLLIAAVS